MTTDSPALCRCTPFLYGLNCSSSVHFFSPPLVPDLKFISYRKSSWIAPQLRPHPTPSFSLQLYLIVELDLGHLRAVL